MTKAICEVESCDNEAEYFDEMDNRICEEHMNQDMEETGNGPECYETICECSNCGFWHEKLVAEPSRGQCEHRKNKGQITKCIEHCPYHEKTKRDLLP